MQSRKVPASIVVSFFGKSTFESDVQPEKAPSHPSYPQLLLISVTLSGITISLRLVQSRKVPASIVVSVFGKSTFESDVQPEKANPPIDVTLSGITISARLVQPEKADPPIDVTLSGITISARLVQPEKADPPIDVTPSGTVYALRPLPLGYTISSLTSLLNSTPATLE